MIFLVVAAFVLYSFWLGVYLVSGEIFRRMLKYPLRTCRGQIQRKKILPARRRSLGPLFHPLSVAQMMQDAIKSPAHLAQVLQLYIIQYMFGYVSPPPPLSPYNFVGVYFNVHHVFLHNERTSCFQVQHLTCRHLSVFFIDLRRVL